MPLRNSSAPTKAPEVLRGLGLLAQRRRSRPDRSISKCPPSFGMLPEKRSPAGAARLAAGREHGVRAGEEMRAEIRRLDDGGDASACGCSFGSPEDAGTETASYS